MCQRCIASGSTINWETASMGVCTWKVLLNLSVHSLCTKLDFTRLSIIFLERLKVTHQKKVLFALIKSKCLPILFYDIEACPTNSADLQFNFTMNKILFKIFSSMSQEMFREISKYFGINPLEDVISARRDKFLKRYCALDNLCHNANDKH